MRRKEQDLASSHLSIADGQRIVQEAEAEIERQLTSLMTKRHEAQALEVGSVTACAVTCSVGGAISGE